MSCLKLHWPQTFSVYAPVEFGRGESERVETEWHGDTDDDADSGPVILSFPRIAGRIGPSRQHDLLTRARIIHENRCCQECGRAAVVPVDAEPALSFRDSMPVPGSGTVIGFACDCCGHEWRV